MSASTFSGPDSFSAEHSALGAASVAKTGQAASADFVESMEFIAVDVETANSDMASICQIGMARYCAGVFNEWKSYVDPEDDFDPINTSIHGIDERTVAGAPRFQDIASSLCERLNRFVVVSHTSFDRLSLTRAFERLGSPPPACRWLDSARVARRTWPEVARKGYGLADLCERLGYDFRHHDAGEDARAAAHVFLEATRQTGLGLDDWLVRAMRPNPIARKGCAEGPLAGEVVVFTGALPGMRRREAAEAVSKLGGDVAERVTKRTTILIVGDQDPERLNGHSTSSKQRKAEEFARKGQRIRILRESDLERIALGVTAE